MSTLTHQQGADGSIEMKFGKKKDPITIYETREVKINAELVEIEPKSCTICIEDFTVGESANQLNCGHMFHLYCYWLLVLSQLPSTVPRQKFSEIGNYQHQQRITYNLQNRERATCYLVYEERIFWSTLP